MMGLRRRGGREGLCTEAIAGPATLRDVGRYLHTTFTDHVEEGVAIDVGGVRTLAGGKLLVHSITGAVCADMDVVVVEMVVNTEVEGVSISTMRIFTRAVTLLVLVESGVVVNFSVHVVKAQPFVWCMYDKILIVSDSVATGYSRAKQVVPVRSTNSRRSIGIHINFM